VSDLAAGHVQALDYLGRGGATTAANLGTGRAFSVREVIAAAERVTGRRVPVRAAARRAGDPPVLVADATRARTVLGFAPGFTEIEPIVETAWRWHKRKARR
jgi:UDP-glucose 4-epimerase